MAQKIRLGILFGGRSAEHEISLISARNISKALDKTKYDISLIGIDKEGAFHLLSDQDLDAITGKADSVKMLMGQTGLTTLPGTQPDKLERMDSHSRLPLDVVFPVMHGTYGEDGSIQGFLRMLDLPYVGPGILGSAVGMDKVVMKRLLLEAGLPVGPFRWFRHADRHLIHFDTLVRDLGLPMFIKPANMGSSVGISKVRTQEEFDAAIELAFRFDTKILIEQNIPGREIECAVLGNENPIASLPGEVIPQADFYSYEAKYLDEKGALMDIPARMDTDTIRRVQELALRTFLALDCEGMSRVDFFLQEDGNLVVNEINTIPGFTQISMYPKLWEISGIQYHELIDRLIQLALARHQREKALRTSM